ncbi:MAG: glycosyltransferase family 2 protein [Planctomycetota bacterium]|nr:glycosyltransferase family 2 protein [Planctomycetota bacterium]
MPSQTSPSTPATEDGSLTSAPLTVVAAVLNERENIEPWLENLSWVDRIVVVDHGSVDGSRELLEEQSHVEVVDAPAGEGLIEDIRRLGLDCVTDGWILVLDLDERVTDDLRFEIRELLEKDPPPDGFRIPFRHYLFGRWLQHGGWDDHHLRLFRAGSGDYLPGLIHSDAVVTGTVGQLEGKILHFAHPTIHDFLARMNRYTTQSAPALARGEVGGLRKRRMLPPSRLAWMRASASVFWCRYIKDRGFKDGMPGFITAVLMAAYIFVEQSKAWEYQLESQR